MKLYHGSPVGGITALTPHLSTHQKPYVYLTHLPELAVIYARNPFVPPNAMFSYYVKDGELHYDEYFSGQLGEFYRGFSGYIYTCELNPDSLRRAEKMDWIYMSEVDVPVDGCRFVPDLYDEIMSLERSGRITIHRYEEQPAEYMATIRRLIREEVDKLELRDRPDIDYSRFIRDHFPEVW